MTVQLLALFVVGIVAAYLAGLGVIKLLGRSSSFAPTVSDYHKFAWVNIFVAPLICMAGTHLFIQHNVTFKENWNGWETKAVKVVTPCSKDGPCHNTYNCDPYEVEVEDSNGKKHKETRYHQCPWTQEEWTFIVKTTLSDHNLGDHHLPTNPDQHRWEESDDWRRTAVPHCSGWGDRVPSYLPSGVPPAWQAAKDRLDINRPGPVTERRDSDNYIHAVRHSIMQKYSHDVPYYLEQKLLPDLRVKLDYPYRLNRSYFVDVAVPGDWDKATNYFNAAFGQIQGDLHLVVVNAKRIDNPQSYLAAVAAYWSSEKYGHNKLPKNSLLVILGTDDGQTVNWAKAITGMPSGNEELLNDIENKLPGVSLTPEAVLGRPHAEFRAGQDGLKYQLTVVHPDPKGALEAAVWGEHPFTRLCMRCHKNKPGSRGFEYLKVEVEPSGPQYLVIVLVVGLLSAISWLIYGKANQ